MRGAAAAPAALALLALALCAAAVAPPAAAQDAGGPPPGPTARLGLSARLGLTAGFVIDPAPFGIEQVHGAAGLLLGLEGRSAISFRPMLLFNHRDVLLRLPLVLRLPLRTGRACSVGLTASAGACTWTGDSPRLHPLLSAGGELSAGAVGVAAALSAVLGEHGSDLLGDVFLSCSWPLPRPPRQPLPEP
jgi:hypothetical protein